MKRAGYLIAALALFGVAGWLMLPEARQRDRRPPPEFPHAARPHEIERGERRRTLALPASGGGAAGASGADGPSGGNAPLYDPLHVALPPADAAIVLEAGTLFDSPAGRMLLGCLSPPQTETLRELEARTGFAVLEQLDRVALAESPEGATTLVLSGDFAGLDLARLADGVEPEPVGRRALLARRDDRALAVWDRRLLLVGEPSGVREALRRLDGEAEAAASDLSGEMYGDAYGTLSGEALSRLLPESLGERLRGAADRVLLHVDATDDLLLVAEVYGSRPDALAELGQALAGAMAVGRLQAVREGDALLADLLDESRVIPQDGSFQLEMALPLATIERALGDCARRPERP